MKNYYVYMLASENNNVLYTGVTNDLERRYFEHSLGLNSSFAKKYRVKKLVYFEDCSDINMAIAREKQIKNWHRQWKINLIKEKNPMFKDVLDAETSSA